MGGWQLADTLSLDDFGDRRVRQQGETLDPPNFRFWILLYERLRQRLRSVQVLDFRFLGYLADPMWWII